MSSTNSSGLLPQAQPSIADSLMSFKVLVLVIVVGLSIAYLRTPSKRPELPAWIPLEIGAAGYFINSHGLGLRI